MVTLDRIKIVTKSTYITITNEDMGEWRDNRIKRIKSFVISQKQPSNLLIMIIPEQNKAIIEFTGKILLDDYYKLISHETIHQCLININNLSLCELQIENIISDSEVISCDVTKDISIELSSDIKNILVSQLSNLNKFHIQKYTTTGYTITKQVKTKQNQLRLSIYDKHRDILTSRNSTFLNSCIDPDKLKNSFKNKYRIEANLKTLYQIREYCGITDLSLNSVLISDGKPLLKIFDVIFGLTLNNNADIFRRRNVFEYESLNQLRDGLILQICDYDLNRAEHILNHYLAKNTNKRKYRTRFRELINESIPANKNKFIIKHIRDQLIAS